VGPSCCGTWASAVRSATHPGGAGEVPRAYFFGALSLGLLLLELSLGFIVLSLPGGLEVSVVEPVWVESTGPVAGGRI